MIISFQMVNSLECTKHAFTPFPAILFYLHTPRAVVIPFAFVALFRGLHIIVDVKGSLEFLING